MLLSGGSPKQHQKPIFISSRKTLRSFLWTFNFCPANWLICSNGSWLSANCVWSLWVTSQPPSCQYLKPSGQKTRMMTFWSFSLEEAISEAYILVKSRSAATRDSQSLVISPSNSTISLKLLRMDSQCSFIMLFTQGLVYHTPLSETYRGLARVIGREKNVRARHTCNVNTKHRYLVRWGKWV
ncbi:hypothetical protein B0O99DRAFT_631129 [Bisporella sp. PMI_857]|nr:hypothetical protein B0O99DRAFT_631129 [Bisporella sp. PMI_857]